MQSISNSHIFSIYRYPKEQLHLTLQYFVKGLLNNEKCVYIADSKSRNDLIEELRPTFNNIDELIQLKKILLLDSEEVYSKNESLPNKEILVFAKAIEDEAKELGFNRVIFSGVPHFEKGEKLESEVLKYEEMIDDFSKKSNSVIICNCNESYFNKDSLLKLIRKHNSIIIYGERYQIDKDNLPNDYNEAIEFILTNKK